MKISFELLRSKSAPKSSPALSDMIRANAAAGDIKASLRMADQFNRRMLALHENIVDDFDKDRRDESELRGKLTRMYEAAMVNNLNADSPISITSGNAEKFVSVVATRSRARSAERDDVFISGAIEAYQDNVGGHEPFRLKMKVGKKNADGEFIEETETNEKIEAWWKEAGRKENCCANRSYTRSEMYWQAISAVVRDGGILYRHRRGFPNNKFGYAIEPIEIDRLDHFYNRPKTGDLNKIEFSIEVDDYDGPVKYWILTKHPGDVFQWSMAAKYREGVPADQVITLFNIRTRAGDFIGMSKFASAIAHLHRLRQYDIAYVTAAIFSACKPFFILQEFPTASEYVPDNIRSAMEAYYEKTIGKSRGGNEGAKTDFSRPGEAQTLAYGQKPVMMDPKFPNESGPAFRKDMLRAAGTGTGVPYFKLANDLEGVNFSSGRLGLQDFHDACMKLQEHIIDNLCHPHFCEALKYAILSGALDLPISRLDEFRAAAEITGRRWPYVNPLQDVQADILEVEAGFNSRENRIRNSERGGGVQEVDQEIAAGRRVDVAHDLNFTADPTKPSLPKGVPGQESPQPQNEPSEPGVDLTVPNASKTGGKQTIKEKIMAGVFRRNGEFHAPQD